MERNLARLVAAKQAAKDRTCNYTDYLQLESLLSAQKPQSQAYGQLQHDEMLFIITHQTYELWFKQIIFEIDAVLNIFTRDAEVKEAYVGIAVDHLRRAGAIQKLLVDQVSVLETMTPMSFLGFRDFIDPASGFQSAQFRMIENKLGLTGNQRFCFHENKKYTDFLSEKERCPVMAAQHTTSLFSAVHNWLVRMPFVEIGEWSFASALRAAVEDNCAADIAASNAVFVDDPMLAVHVERAEKARDRLLEELSPKRHDELVQQKQRRLSYKAMLSALMIFCYRHEPVMQGPAQLLDALIEIDMQLTTWRFRHMMMVQRMIGSKPGTGGSPGHPYLKKTVDHCRIFGDFFNVSSLMLPKDALPQLPEAILKEMQFALDHFDPGSGRDSPASSTCDLEPAPQE